MVLKFKICVLMFCASLYRTGNAIMSSSTEFTRQTTTPWRREGAQSWKKNCSITQVTRQPKDCIEQREPKIDKFVISELSSTFVCMYVCMYVWNASQTWKTSWNNNMCLTMMWRLIYFQTFAGHFANFTWSQSIFFYYKVHFYLFLLLIKNSRLTV